MSLRLILLCISQFDYRAVHIYYHSKIATNSNNSKCHCRASIAFEDLPGLPIIGY